MLSSSLRKEKENRVRHGMLKKKNLMRYDSEEEDIRKLRSNKVR